VGNVPSVSVEAGRGGPALSEVLAALAHDATRDRIAIGDLLGALGDRALGALIFIFAAPNILPVPPGVSAILGTPLIFLSAQVLLGRGPWLPRLIRERSLARDDFVTLMRRILPWLAKAEKLLRPRLGAFSRPPIENAIGLVCLVLALVLILPIPLGNTLPALAISVLALGLLERDGLWTLAGLCAAAVAATVVSGVVFALAKSALYLIARTLQ
jgi:hypothetical protein